MKKLYLLIFGMLLSIVLQAQVEKTIENKAGKLDSLLTSTELNSITDLTVTGTVNEYDFRVIRSKMPTLKHINLSDATVLAYTLTWDTGETIIYEANTIPDYAFQSCDSLTSILLPSSVTVLGQQVFMDCYSLTTVKLPSSLMSMEGGVFWGCYSLASVSIPSSVTSIGGYTFYLCGKLTEIELPPGITFLGTSFFEGCSSLTTVDIPSTVTAIGESAFSRCSSLTDVQIPTAITAIEYSTFSGCSSLKSVTLPPGVTSIGSYAFNSCSAMSSIPIPPAVTSIGNNAFAGCISLTSIDIPSISIIYSHAFSACQSLTSITIPSTVTLLGDNAFEYCTSLTSVTIPPSVTSIGSSAFEQCENLSSVVIPSSVHYIGPAAFGGCRNLTAIYSKRSVPVTLESGHFYWLDMSQCTLYVPYGAKANYAIATEWHAFNIVEDTTGLSIGVGIIRFDMDGGIFQLAINANLAWQASSDQSWLTVSPASGTVNDTITVTAEVNSNLSYRFASITVTPAEGEPQVIRVIQRSSPVVIPLTAGELDKILTREELDTITSLTLTGTLNAKDIFTINSMHSLRTLDISQARIVATQVDNIPYPGDWLGGPSVSKNSMGICGGLSIGTLTTLKLPSTLTVLACGALSGSGFTSFTIPPSVTTIGWEAFNVCGSLESITIPATVTFMDQWAFSSCQGLKEVIIEEGIDYIPRGTFAGCSSLTSVTLPSSMKGIEMDAFWQAPNITTIYSYNPIPPYDSNGFNSTDKSTCIVYVPLGSKAAYGEAEGWKEYSHIVEMAPFTLSASSLSMEAVAAEESLQITTDSEWSAACDKDWLTVSPASGNSTKTVTFTCLENKAFEPRTSTVTFSYGNGYSQIVTVTQKARENTIPEAHAGLDQSVEEGATVQLDGSASRDADMDTLTYQWTAPQGIALSAASDARPTFTAPKVEKDTTFTFKLVVNDGKQNSASDHVLVTVTNKKNELGLSADSIVFESRQSSAAIIVTGNAKWTVTTDKDWLTVTPALGEGQAEITLLAKANESTKERVAIVTVSAPETDAKTITITQHGLVTAIENKISWMTISIYPNPFTSEMTIELSNPLLEEVSVEIFSMSGQKIRTLARALKGQNITLTWKGEDEMGKQVPEGMYLVKVNGEVKKVVKN